VRRGICWSMTEALPLSTRKTIGASRPFEACREIELHPCSGPSHV
jgi:hypothetical protein